MDLDVSSGEIVSILGPNGAGKTTFLRQLTTELRPTAGSIHVFGVDAVREPHAAKESMGITPQEAGLFDALTVREHLALFGRLKGLRAHQCGPEADRLLDELNLREAASRRVGTLSGGQRRRILIGLALLGRPPLLILDEPTTGLDPASRRDVWGVLRGAVSAGASIVLSTHYMEEAERLSDRIAIVSDGRVVACGSVTELMARIRESYRVTWVDCGGERHVTRWETFADAQASIARRGLSEYSIARASLEDVYFELVGARYPDVEIEEAVAQ
jgi:ABC-2 type transport system ATP-binding protein